MPEGLCGRFLGKEKNGQSIAFMKNARKNILEKRPSPALAVRGLAAALALLLLVCLPTVGRGQKPAPDPKPKDLKKSGDFYFRQREYQQAVPYYLKYQLAEPEDFGAKYNIGISYFYMDSIDRALAYLRYVLQDEDTPDEVYLYLAKCYASKDSYETAARYVKLYLAALDPKSPERPAIKARILQYINARDLRVSPSTDLVQNLGPRINTRYDEWMPVFHLAEPNALYFTSRRAGNYGPVQCPERPGHIGGCYTADVFRTQLERGVWEPPAAGIFGLNSVEEDVLFGFGGKKGSTAWFFRGKNPVQGDWFAPEVPDRKMPDSIAVAPLPFNALGVFEGNLALFGERTVLFSSERPGGYGGRDLWFSRRYPDGTWLDPQNLGPEVNTPANEDCPFLCPDGRTLYFSSDRPESVGGYDIFRAVFSDAKGIFQSAENLGFPINSPADDRDFRLFPQASTAYFSSDRTGGYGGFDLYEIYFRPLRPAQQALSDPPSFADVLLPIPPDPQETPVAPRPAPPPVPTPAPQPPAKTPEKPAATVATKYAPIYFDKKTSNINPASNAAIAQVAQWAKQHPAAQLVVVAHSDSTADPLNREIYLCFKQAELVAQKLVDAGVEKKRLVLNGVGPFYPFSRYAAADGQRNAMAGMMNSRVEIWCRGPEPTGDGHVLECQYPEIVPQLTDPRGRQFTENTARLHYRVQLGNVAGEYKDPALGRFPGAFAEAEFGAATVQYCTGLFFQFGQAKAVMDRLRNEGYGEAVVVAYLRNQRLSRVQADELVKQFPELAAYVAIKKQLGE